MKRFGICLDFTNGVWKSFYPSLKEAKINSNNHEIYEIELMPAESINPCIPHMIVSKIECARTYEGIFRSMNAART